MEPKLFPGPEWLRTQEAGWSGCLLSQPTCLSFSRIFWRFSERKPRAQSLALQHVFHQFPPPFTLNRARGDFQGHGFNFCILLSFPDRVTGIPRVLQQVAVKLALWVQFLAPIGCSPPFLQDRTPTSLLGGIWLTGYSQCFGKHKPDPSPLWPYHSTAIHGAPAI